MSLTNSCPSRLLTCVIIPRGVLYEHSVDELDALVGEVKLVLGHVSALITVEAALELVRVSMHDLIPLERADAFPPAVCLPAEEARVHVLGAEVLRRR